MRTSSFLAGLTLAGIAVAQQPQALTYPDLLARMTAVDWLWQPPVEGERCLQFSSYDRRSHKGPDDPDAWYANDDRGKYLRVDEVDGSKAYVMVDIAGPGVLTRLWSANPAGELHFEVDGARVWTVDFRALCSGEVEPIGGALAGVRARGANCYLPIPFGDSLRVIATEGDSYYQANVTRFPPGTRVPSFTPELLTTHAEALRALAAPTVVGSEGWNSSVTVTEHVIPRGKIVRSFSILHEGAPAGTDLGELLRRVLLVVRCGREETVRVPLADFFCGGADWRPFASHFLQITGREAYSRWPMPMPAGGKLELLADGDLEGFRIGFSGVTFADLEAADPLLFRASYRQRKDFDSRPFHDFTILDANGTGRFAGCSLLVKNPTRGWWGEGDEKFWVDGEGFPSTFGTGTEDYFGYAWCSPETFASAFHAQTQCDGPGNYGFTALHRAQVLDSVPFQRSFRFDLEVWHWVEGLKMDYASVAYWYGAPGATSGLPAVPPAAERTLDRLPPPPMFVAPAVIEGEDLEVETHTGGTHERQDLSFRENTFSRDAHRWWRDGSPGDTLVLRVPVAEKGRYRVIGCFCMAPDYGIVQLTLEDKKLGAPFDGYATAVETSGARELGTVELGKGDARLRVVILGRNDEAVPKHMFGLDYLRLEKVQ